MLKRGNNWPDYIISFINWYSLSFVAFAQTMISKLPTFSPSKYFFKCWFSFFSFISYFPLHFQPVVQKVSMPHHVPPQQLRSGLHRITPQALFSEGELTSQGANDRRGFLPPSYSMSSLIEPQTCEGNGTRARNEHKQKMISSTQFRHWRILAWVTGVCFSRVVSGPLSNPICSSWCWVDYFKTKGFVRYNPSSLK